MAGRRRRRRRKRKKGLQKGGASVRRVRSIQRRGPSLQDKIAAGASMFLSTYLYQFWGAIRKTGI